MTVVTLNGIDKLRNAFRELVDAEGLRPLAARTGIPVGQIRSLIDGRAVRVTTLELMTEVLGVRLTIGPGWPDEPAAAAAGGLGRTLGKSAVDPHQGAITAQLREGAALVRDLADRMASAAHSLFQVVAGWDAAGNPPGSLALIPFATGVRVRAGDVEPVFKDSGVTVGIAPEALPDWTRPDRLVCLQTAEDAMEATCRGDLVAVDRERTDPVEGELFALLTEAGVTVRRLRREAEWMLAADNPACSDRALSAGDRILGRVAWHGPHDPRARGEN